MISKEVGNNQLKEGINGYKVPTRLYLKIPLFFIGVPGRIRTADLPLRRGLRYPSVPPGQYLNQYDKYKRVLLTGLDESESKKCGTESRSRTDTVSPPPDFESGASTSSAIPALFRTRSISKIPIVVNPKLWNVLYSNQAEPFFSPKTVKTSPSDPHPTTTAPAA